MHPMRSVVAACVMAFALDAAALVPTSNSSQYASAQTTGQPAPSVRTQAVVQRVEPASRVVVYRHPRPSVQRWYRTSLAAGWTESQWRKLSCIIWRESGGRPGAYNPERQAGTDSGWGSRGLTQIYGRANWYWLKHFVGRDLNLLYNPYVNLRAARKLYEMKGWQPWSSTARPCG